MKILSREQTAYEKNDQFESALRYQNIINSKGDTNMIVGIGDNCIDYYLPPINIKRTGGNVVNVAVNLRKHNFAATYIGTVGTDKKGEIILSSLNKFGLDTSHVSRLNGETGLTEIEVVNGEYIIKSENYGVSNQIDISDETLEFLKENARIIHLSITGSAFTVIEKLKDIDIPISCDISNFFFHYTEEHWASLLPYIDYVFVSGGSTLLEEEAIEIAQKIASFGTKNIIITLGSNGCIGFFENRVISQPSLLKPSEVIDPLGAGDAFISGFLSSVISANNTSEQHLKIASQWAAKTCQHYGAW